MSGSTSEGLVELIDLFPALAELCDVTPPSELQGQSLVPMLRDPATSGKEVTCPVVTRGKLLGNRFVRATQTAAALSRS